MTWRWPDVFTIILNVFYLLNKYKLSIRWQNACSGLCATGSSSKVLSFRGLRNLCIKLWYRRFFSFKDNMTMTWFWFMCRTLNYHVDVGVVGPSLAVKLWRWGTLSSGDSPVVNPLLPWRNWITWYFLSLGAHWALSRTKTPLRLIVHPMQVERVRSECQVLENHLVGKEMQEISVCNDKGVVTFIHSAEALYKATYNRAA